MTESMRIGELLLTRGLLDEEQLTRALLVQTEGEAQVGLQPGERLGKVILRLGLVEPMELVRALCEQKGKIDFLVVEEYLVEPSLAQRIPRKLALSLNILPLVRLDEETVLVAVTELLREDRVDFLRQLTASLVEQIPVEDRDFGRKIVRCYRAVEARQLAATRIGELLVEEGLITPEQRDEALAEAGQLQKKIGHVLVDQGLVGEDDLFAALARLKGLPLLRADEVEWAGDVLDIARTLPRNYTIYNEVVPYKVIGDTVHVVTSDPNVDVKDVTTVFGCQRAEVHLTTASDMKRILLRCYPPSEDTVEAGELPSGSLEEGPTVPSGESVAPTSTAGGEPIAGGRLLPVDSTPQLTGRGPTSIQEDIINNLLYVAVSRSATHVHVENHENQVVLRFRVGGKLREVPGLYVTKTNVSGVIAALKTMAGLDARTGLPQAGALKRRTLEGQLYDFRVQTHPGVFGENVVIRVLARPQEGLEDLAMEMPTVLAARYLEAVRRRKGVMLIVSPTGRQRSDIAYGTLDLFTKEHDLKIVTVEDPIERTVSGVTQSEVSYEVKYTFALAVAGLQRVDPDVIYVGEVPDGDTAAGVFKLARSGCLALGGVQAGSVAEALGQVGGWGLALPRWSEELVGVLARRSLLTLCSRCKFAYEPSPEVLFAVYGDDVPSLPFYRAAGCPDCQQTGHQDQINLSEYFAPDAKSRQMLSDGADPLTILRNASRSVFLPITVDIQEKVNAGLVDVTEAVTSILQPAGE